MPFHPKVWPETRSMSKFPPPYRVLSRVRTSAGSGRATRTDFPQHPARRPRSCIQKNEIPLFWNERISVRNLGDTVKAQHLRRQFQVLNKALDSRHLQIFPAMDIPDENVRLGHGLLPNDQSTAKSRCPGDALRI